MAAQMSLGESLAILEARFVDNGCESTPRTLVAFLQTACGAESGRTGRSKMYRRLYSILWYGSQVGAGHFEGRQPSYIYPEALKAVVRARFPDEEATESKPDPEGSLVYAVTFQDLFQAKWPAVKSSHSSAAHKESSARRK